MTQPMIDRPNAARNMPPCVRNASAIGTRVIVCVATAR